MSIQKKYLVTVASTVKEEGKVIEFRKALITGWADTSSYKSDATKTIFILSSPARVVYFTRSSHMLFRIDNIHQQTSSPAGN